MRRIAVALLGMLALCVVPFLLVGCLATPPHTGETTPAQMGRCPPTGARVPFTQLVAESQHLLGCAVTTEVDFVATGTGTATLPFPTAGQTIFQVVAPGQTPTTGSQGGASPSYASISNAAAEPLLSMQPGTRLVLRGAMLYRSSGNSLTRSATNPGTTARLFRAATVGRALTPSPEVRSTPGASAGSAPSPASTSMTQVPRVALLTEGPGLDGAELQLAVRDALARQGALLIDRASVTAARAFVSQADLLDPSVAEQLRERLDVDRLVLIQTRSQGREGTLALQVVRLEPGIRPNTTFRTLPPVQLEAEVVRLVEALPPVPPLSHVGSANGPQLQVEPGSSRAGSSPPPASAATGGEGESGPTSATHGGSGTGQEPQVEAPGPRTAGHLVSAIEAGALLGWGSFTDTTTTAFTTFPTSVTEDLIGGGPGIHLFVGWRPSLGEDGMSFLVALNFSYQFLSDEGSSNWTLSAWTFGLGARWYPVPARRGVLDPWVGVGFDLFARFNVAEGAERSHHFSAVGLPLSVGLGYRVGNGIILDLTASYRHWFTNTYCREETSGEICTGSVVSDNGSWFLGLGARYDWNL